jgi:Flp pilus assembly protein TadG
MYGRLCDVTARRHARPRERGAVAVEFALVMPLLVMLLVGAVTSGWSYSKALGVTNAVREGARFGATTPYPPPAGDWVDDVLERSAAAQFDDPEGESKICVRLYREGSGVIASGCRDSSISTVQAVTEPAFTPPGTLSAGVCVVRVWAARPYYIMAPPLYIPDAEQAQIMTTQSIAVYERQPCGTP